MKEIKTRGSHKKTKALDKTSDLASKMKQGLIRSKDQFQNLADDGQVTPDEYAENNIKYASEDIVHDVAHGSKKTVKKTFDGGKNLARSINQKRFDAKSIKQKSHGADSIKQTAKSTGNQTFKTMQRDIKTAGQSTNSAIKVPDQTAKTGIKTSEQATKATEKSSVQTAKKSIKTSEQTARTAIKTSSHSAKSAQRTAQAANKTAEAGRKLAEKSAKTTKKAAETAKKNAKVAAKATESAIKSMIAGIKSLVAAIAAGGWVAAVIIIVIVMIALIVGSCFGIFYSSGDTDGLTMQGAISNINTEYQTKIEETKNSVAHDILEMKGSRARWQDVLAVYAVKTTTDPNSPQEVATMDDGKYDILKGVFWDMHQISKNTETKKVKEYTEKPDTNGDIIVTEKEVSKTILHINVKHMTVAEMKSKYGFNNDQKAQLDELLAEDKSKLWSSVLYGTVSDDIVNVAKSQLGNVGGQPYWSWYGFDSRVEWCACFVSWCANECGYIDSGVAPKFAGCGQGVQWFKERNQWQDNTFIPKPGDMIFFDWEYDGLTGTADHVGIVEKVESDTVYTIEGNSSDSCTKRSYPVGYYEILGYGQLCP
ncbi:MAG: CHAP domain-containing protein [Clostridia bacterium]|nr:CHAP domain-containing protein [Clostridia bacterium]